MCRGPLGQYPAGHTPPTVQSAHDRPVTERVIYRPARQTIQTAYCLQDRAQMNPISAFWTHFALEDAKDRPTPWRLWQCDDALLLWNVETREHHLHWIDLELYAHMHHHLPKVLADLVERRYMCLADTPLLCHLKHCTFNERLNPEPTSWTQMLCALGFTSSASQELFHFVLSTVLCPSRAWTSQSQMWCLVCSSPEQMQVYKQLLYTIQRMGTVVYLHNRRDRDNSHTGCAFLMASLWSQYRDSFIVLDSSLILPSSSLLCMIASEQMLLPRQSKQPLTVKWDIPLIGVQHKTSSGLVSHASVGIQRRIIELHVPDMWLSPGPLCAGEYLTVLQQCMRVHHQWMSRVAQFETQSAREHREGLEWERTAFLSCHHHQGGVRVLTMDCYCGYDRRCPPPPHLLQYCTHGRGSPVHRQLISLSSPIRVQLPPPETGSAAVHIV